MIKPDIANVFGREYINNAKRTTLTSIAEQSGCNIVSVIIHGSLGGFYHTIVSTPDSFCYLITEKYNPKNQARRSANTFEELVWTTMSFKQRKVLRLTQVRKPDNLE